MLGKHHKILARYLLSSVNCHAFRVFHFIRDKKKADRLTGQLSFALPEICVCVLPVGISRNFRIFSEEGATGVFITLQPTQPAYIYPDIPRLPPSIALRLHCHFADRDPSGAVRNIGNPRRFPTAPFSIAGRPDRAAPCHVYRRLRLRGRSFRLPTWKLRWA